MQTTQDKINDVYAPLDVPVSDFATTQVIIAALNEEQGIGYTIEELQKNLKGPHLLVVDGNSIDRTVEVAKDRGVDVLFQDGHGKGDALSKAFKHVSKYVNYVIMTDGDYTYPAEYLPDMIRTLELNSEVGMVCGNRFSGKIDANTLLNRFYVGNRLLAFAHNLFNGVALNDPLTGLRVIRADILRDWQVKSTGFDVEVELNHQVEKRGYKIAEVPIHYRKRLGEKKLKMKHGMTIFRRILLQTKLGRFKTAKRVVLRLGHITQRKIPESSIKKYLRDSGLKTD